MKLETILLLGFFSFCSVAGAIGAWREHLRVKRELQKQLDNWGKVEPAATEATNDYKFGRN